MADTTTKINALLRVAAKDSGASAHEAHTAATCAVNLARKHGLGHLVARSLNAQAKAAARVARVEEQAAPVVSDATIESVADAVDGLVNPLYDLWLDAQGGSSYAGAAYFERAYTARRKAVKHYAWAVPSEEAIRRIVECGPVVEIGAGSGYWASLVAQLGGDIVAFDQHDPESNPDYPFEQGWFPVQKGGPEKAAEHSDRALFLCWPPYNAPFAAECLKAYTGNTLIFVGEGWGGCTADDEFFNILGEGYGSWDDEGNEIKPDLGDDWEEVETVTIPRWDGINDYMTIYRREGC